MIQLVNTHDERLTVDILNAFQQHYKSLNLPFLSLNELFSFLGPSERALISRLSQTKTPHIAHTEPAIPREYLYVPPQRQRSVPGVRVHKAIATAFLAMANAAQIATKQKLVVLSGYRSPAYQIMILLRVLYDSDFDMERALTLCKLPEESEHCRAPYHAVDIGIQGAARMEDFADTKAFAWMNEYAAGYGFVLSYPQKNDRGMAFEPWHWHYIPR